MRLNNKTRDAILMAALNKSGIFQKKDAIRQRYAAWAESVRQLYITPEQLELIAAAEEASNAVDCNIIYQRFKPQRSTAIEYANIGGQSRTVYFCGAQNYAKSKKDDSRIVPCSGNITLKADHPLTQELFNIDHDANKHQEETQQLTASILAVLRSVSTVAKLVQIWPEAVAFIPAAEKATTVNLPALQIADLNKMIGLP